MSVRAVPELPATTPSLPALPASLSTGRGGVREPQQAPQRPSPMLMESPVDMSERVLASLGRVGNEPGVVTVYSAPVGRTMMTDVSVRLTDGEDGTREVHNHYGTQTILPSSSDEGVAMLGSYEESARVADDANLYFQGMKINRRV